MTRTPVNVTVTGAAGQIGYALLFRIASGHLLGADVPVKLRLLEIPQALKAAEGTAMELDDCAFPLLAGIDITDDPNVAFDGANVALLVGARPRTKGMERGDLLAGQRRHLQAAGQGHQRPRRGRHQGPGRRQPGQHQRAHRAGRRPGRTGRALHRDDPPGPQPRALAARRRRPASRSPRSRKLTIWGNHSATQYPDIFHAEVAGKNAAEVVNDEKWLAERLHPDRRQARRRDHRGPWRVLRRLGRQRRHRPRPHLGQRHRRGRLDLRRCRLRRLLRRPRGPDLVLPRHRQGRQVRDRPGPGHQRVLPRPHRRLGEGARGGARRGPRPRPHLTRIRR